ncbi:tol-pal system YbgF family protein [Streptomyces lincolnensis]|uniref:tol-pal system YbgF family protein n=1 Tax=Streptomyces lincolnensis TaxID=1915 RepID=UPI0037D4722A
MDTPTPAAPEPTGPPEPNGPPSDELAVFHLPRPQDRPHDPLAAALGNASLLGIGYLLLGRRKLAVTAATTTLVLVLLVVSEARTSYEIAVAVWWVLGIAHGWFLARRGTRRVAVRRQRLLALAVTVAVLLTAGLLRHDAHRVAGDVDEARQDGDCARVVSAQGEVWWGDRVGDAPLTASGDEVVRACERLETATADLNSALTGDTEALEKGFDTLAKVLAEPGHGKTVETTLNGFLRGLPTEDPCTTVAVTDWLRQRVPSQDVLDRSTATAERTAPAALVGCGDDFMADDSWDEARTRYEQLLDRYPGGDLADRARKGARKATLNIELDTVRKLLVDSADGQPTYCSDPAKYSGAEPAGKGTNRALFYGGDEYSVLRDYVKQLPGSWKADDASDATLVVCMGEDTFGTSVETCPYENESTGAVTYVSFHKVEIPVKVYEVRTGRLVTDRKIQISGTSCPSRFSYFSTSDGDTSPPSTRYVTTSKSGVRAAFEPLVVR